MPTIIFSIAIIAKNEVHSIGSVLSDIDEALEASQLTSYETFLVDGYSNDGTVRVAEQHGINVVQVHGGKGKGIQKALEVARGRYVIFIDADGSHLCEDIPRLLKKIEEDQCDMVIVSRIAGSSEELGWGSFDNLVRLIGNQLSVMFVNLRWRTRLTDIQNGYRIVRREKLLGLRLKEKSFSIEQEMVMKCLKNGGTITEIPGVERKRQYGVSKIRKRKELWKYLWSFTKNL